MQRHAVAARKRELNASALLKAMLVYGATQPEGTHDPEFEADWTRLALELVAAIDGKPFERAKPPVPLDAPAPRWWWPFGKRRDVTEPVTP
jgi:hypothetical protein